MCDINLLKSCLLLLQVLYWSWLEFLWIFLIRFLLRLWCQRLSLQQPDHCDWRVLRTNDLQVGMISLIWEAQHKHHLHHRHYCVDVSFLALHCHYFSGVSDVICTDGDYGWWVSHLFLKIFLPWNAERCATSTDSSGNYQTWGYCGYGNSNEDSCYFPWTYSGIQYTTCTDATSGWCATSVYANTGEYYRSDGILFQVDTQINKTFCFT